LNKKEIMEYQIFILMSVYVKNFMLPP
jgi:hypothetical protein